MNKANEILQKWISKNFSKNQTDSELNIGVEIELPINLKDQSANSWSCKEANEMMLALINEFNYQLGELDNDKKIISIASKESGDKISFEFSIWIIEISLAPTKNIHDSHFRFERLYDFISLFLEKNGCYISSSAYSPQENKNCTGLLGTSRDRILHNLLKKHNQNNWAFGSLITSVQTHISVGTDELCSVLSIFAMVDWIRSILFSNSLNGKYSCYREILWQESSFGKNPYDLGLPPEHICNINKLVEYLSNQSIFYVIRENKFLAINPTSLINFFELDSHKVLEFEKINFKDEFISPVESDIESFRSYNNIAVTKYGTLEIRGDCSQDLRSTFAPVVFNLGVYLGRQEILAILKRYNYKDLILLRQQSIEKDGVDAILKNSDYCELIKRILVIVQTQLELRGFGEEVFLNKAIARIEDFK